MTLRTRGSRLGALAILGVALSAAAACAPRSTTIDEGTGEVSGLDTSREGLRRFVQEGGYRDWRAEPERHPTSAPHAQQVRVFFNDVLVESMEADNSVHPKGAATVKELYDSSGALTGHAVNVKVEDGAAAESWLFFEGFGPDDDDPFYGRGHPTCTGCHARTGVDYVSSPLP